MSASDDDTTKWLSKWNLVIPGDMKSIWKVTKDSNTAAEFNHHLILERTDNRTTVVARTGTPVIVKSNDAGALGVDVVGYVQKKGTTESRVLKVGVRCLVADQDWVLSLDSTGDQKPEWQCSVHIEKKP